MQVESTLMNVGDGGPVSREISALTKTSTSMVGNPPQALTPEFRGDANLLSQQNKTTPTKDCKALKACLDSSNCNHILENPLPQQPNNAPMSSPVLASSEKGTDKRTDTPKVRADGSGVFPTPQWSSGVKAGREDALNPCHSNVTSSKKSHPQTQSLQSLAPGFQCSAMFKPAQPVAFIPSSNFSPQLCKITLPPALGQITVLRDATSSQFQKELQPQGSGVGGKSLLRTYPYSLSVGRAPDKKAAGSNLKLKPNHSSSKTTKSLGEPKSLASVVCSPAITLPLQHPSLTSAAPTHYTLSPTAAICCGSALAGITSQSRLLNHLEKANSIDKTAMGAVNAMPPSAAENHSACSNEQRDVPLDLSAKSKRLKCVGDAPVSAVEPHGESSPRDFLNAKRTHSTAYCSNTQYPVLPNSHRNGSHQKQLSQTQNHQITESKPTWGKGSAQESIKSIPGTYVGVASPILASTLRGKDGKGTFADELQSFAKQEFISIIDQGEHLASGGKKPSCLVKGNQHAQSGKHVKNTSTALSKNCPTKGALSAALLSSTNAGSQKKCGPNKATGPYSAAAVSPTWQPPSLLPHQRKNPQGSTKTKGSTVAEGSKFKSPSKPEENKWERMKSPLSNLASIVKQQGLETTAHTNEGSTQASPGALRKSDVLNPLGESKDVQSKHGTTFEYPPYWPVEKWPSQGESTQVTKRHEMLNAAELSENNTTVHSTQHAKHGSSNPTGQTHLFGSNASTNGGRMESKLAQVLEGEISRKESGTSNGAAGEKLEGMVASILTGQRRGGSDVLEKTANGTKEESPTKAKAAAIKQKKSSPKKPAKEKPAADPAKKAAGKKKQDKEKTPVKVPVNKKDKSSPVSADASVSPNNSTASNKEPEAAESSFPRLRRGQRRADDARLDLWGFATPSPPPPLPKDVSPSPPSTPSQPARRPRGRPRSNALPERAIEGKVKTAGAEADTPPHKKRRRCSSKKYETGEYITEKDKLEECPSPAAPSPKPPPPPKPSYTRSGSIRYQESEESECSNKPSGKRKFKSKHLSDSDESKTKRSSSGKRGSSLPLDDDGTDAKPQPTPLPTPKSFPSSPTVKKSSSGRSSGSDSSPKRPVPPEVRRLIVNKNAGETLLQRASRLGYQQDVVQYCLDKDIREVNRRDNAGYTALHEASSRGWTQIVQILLKHGADVNCSAQDGTPLHDAVASDNLPIVWLLLNHGADPTLATYSGHTPVKLAHSPSMKTFLTEYFSDLEGRSEKDSSLPWDFYSSSLFTDQEPCWDFLLSEENQEPEEENRDAKPERDSDKDCLLFEFSSEPLLPCYHVQVSLTQFCNWFLLTDVLKRLKMSARIFRARYPHFEVVSLSQAELWRQVSVSQVGFPQKRGGGDDDEEEEEDEEGPVELVCCVPELQRLLGSSVHILPEEDEEEEEETPAPTAKCRSR
uniref:BCL-6 corepressor PCGF1 binding domain-containing protein n=1 Tax=Poecilia mexicana TaxID=48701 RepID=A0A3B3XJQ1_9TELE